MSTTTKNNFLHAGDVADEEVAPFVTPSAATLPSPIPGATTSRSSSLSSFPRVCVPPLLLLLALLIPSAYLWGRSGGWLQGVAAARANNGIDVPPHHLEEAFPNATDKPAAAADFVFLVAPEGSGHHFYMALFKESPAMERLKELEDAPALLKYLQGSLYNNADMADALFSAPCSSPSAKTNGTSMVETVSKQLQIIDAKIRNASVPSTMVPLNAAAVIQYNVAGVETGMMSYPNYGGGCRDLQYPNLGALYYACDVAGVSCRHVILTRDPYEVIRSTTMHRHFDSKKRAMKLYTTMLDVILAQILAHPDHLAACWEYNDDVEDDLGALMGWDRGGTRFRDTYLSLFSRNGGMNSSEKLEIVPQELEVFMSTMEQATERVRKTCREVLQSRKGAV